MKGILLETHLPFQSHSARCLIQQGMHLLVRKTKPSQHYLYTTLMTKEFFCHPRTPDSHAAYLIPYNVPGD